ncbi:hypothetical protein [Spirosoma spitsbergense]|uniref:hypothetical protein n=1 Tax=Spirosoma spitsbergense TaxID=431554 RepID=UPI0003A98824|nr:hypothetical protein [Spirosoma spitsbergense]
MSRLLNILILLIIGLADWLIAYFNPQANAGNWLAAAFGAFVIRFIWPKIPFKASFFGWLTAFIIACLFAPDAVAAGGLFGMKRMEGNYAAMALIGDIVIQTAAWVVRLSQKVGTATLDDPAGAFDGTLDRVEKVTSVWLRIKAPFLDLLNTIFPKKS